jgi:hypothetical protein
MGGTRNHNHIPYVPYANIKFTIPSFLGYFDWEMMVEQKFIAHLVPEQHRVRQATSEFRDFATIWWTGLAAEGTSPSTWEELKVAMRDRFVPASYTRDLHNKLMPLEQGDNLCRTTMVSFKKV